MPTASDTPRSAARTAGRGSLAQRIAQLTDTDRQVLAHLSQAIGTCHLVASFLDPLPFHYGWLLDPEKSHAERLRLVGSLDDPDELGPERAIAAVLPARNGHPRLELHDGGTAVIPSDVSVEIFERDRLRVHGITVKEIPAAQEALKAAYALDDEELRGLLLLASRYRRAKRQADSRLRELERLGFVEAVAPRRERGRAQLRCLADPDVRGLTETSGVMGRPLRVYNLTPAGLQVAADILGLPADAAPSYKARATKNSRIDHSLAASVLYGHLNALRWAGLIDLVSFETEHQWKQHGASSTTPRSDVIVVAGPVATVRRPELLFELIVETDMGQARKRLPRPGERPSVFLYEDFRSYTDLAKSLEPARRPLRLVQMTPAFAYATPETQGAAHAQLWDAWTSEYEAMPGRSQSELDRLLKFIHLPVPTPVNVALRIERNVAGRAKARKEQEQQAAA